MLKYSSRTLLYIRLAGVMVFLVMLQSCNVTEPNSLTIVKGKILEQGSLAPVQGALIRALSYPASTNSDQAGNFSLSFDFSDSTVRVVELAVSKLGFTTDSVSSVPVQTGKTITIADIPLTKSGNTDTTQNSGNASNIVLVKVETNSISVRGTGGNETSDITFEVRDANGTPIDIQHQVEVTFQIKGGPGGGESLSSLSAMTNAVGIVVTTINSGTIAGPLQIVASIGSQSIVSAPIPVSIHGGLPEINHFSVAPDQLNFAGYKFFNLQNSITAFVGDRYSNPVLPGTSVQFQSGGGIIEGSAVTDELGRATVILTSAEPKPEGIPSTPFPFTELGFARITAETVDESNNTITASTVVLFSGTTQAGISPTNFSIAPFSSELFQYTVHDQNNNPLVSGTAISVSADNGEVSGITNFTLDDTQSRAFTRFSFVLTNTSPDSADVKDSTITLNVSSRNGDVTIFVTGKMLPK